MKLELAEFKRQSLTLAKGPVAGAGRFSQGAVVHPRGRKTDRGDPPQGAGYPRASWRGLPYRVLPAKPYELYCIFSRQEAIYFELDYPELLAELRVHGDPGNSERRIRPRPRRRGRSVVFRIGRHRLYSPEIFKKHLLQPSIDSARLVREAGGISSFRLVRPGKGISRYGSLRANPGRYRGRACMPPPGTSLRSAMPGAEFPPRPSCATSPWIA